MTVLSSLGVTDGVAEGLTVSAKARANSGRPRQPTGRHRPSDDDSGDVIGCRCAGAPLSAGRVGAGRPGTARRRAVPGSGAPAALTKAGDGNSPRRHGSPTHKETT